MRFSHNNSFENNYLKTAGNYGLWIDRSNDNLFDDNTFLGINKSVIHFRSYANRNRFYNNTLTKKIDQYAVEYNIKSIWNWFPANNTVNNIPMRIYYDTPGDIVEAELDSLTLDEPLMTNLGQIMIINCSNISVSSLNIKNGDSAIFTYMVHNITIDNSVVDNVNNWAMNFDYNSTNITIINTSLTIPLPALGYLYLGEKSNVTLLNTTIDQSRVTLMDGSNLTIQWFMHVEVRSFTTNQRIKAANVKAKDRLGNQIYNGTTDSKGQIKYIVTTQRTITNVKIINYNDHNITVFKLNYQLGFARPEPKIVSSQWVNIEMFDNHKPVLVGIINPPITHNLTPRLTWSPGTDPDNDELIYYINLWNIKEPSNILEQNVSQETSYVISKELSYGERYSVNVSAYDNFGGWSNDIKGVFDVLNHGPSPPKIAIYPEQTDKKPSKNVDLNCTIIEESIDIDSNPKDEVRYSFLWYKNGVLQSNQSVWNTSKLSHTLDKQYTDTGEVWTCKVFANDGFVNSQTISDSVIIKNTPPTVEVTFPSLELNEDTFNYGSIRLSEIFRDEDLDQLEYSFTSSGNNISIEILQNGTVVVTPLANWNGFENVRFFAQDDEYVKYIDTRIKVLAVPDAPEVEIVLPKTDKYFIFNLTLRRGIRFVGVFEDFDMPYGSGDVVNLTWISNISGVIGYNNELDNVILPLGEHKIEFIATDSHGLTDRESIIIHVIPQNQTPIDFIAPEVKLISPIHNLTINQTSIILSWAVQNLNASVIERVLFDVYLDTNEIPRKIIRSDYPYNNITIQVEPNTTYYWTIIPYLDEFPGICVDWVWNFTIDLDFISFFGVELNMTEPEINVKTGKVAIYNFTIRNTGNIVDKFRLTLSFLGDNELVNYTEIEILNVTLQSQFYSKINITFNIPLNYTSKNDTMILTASSILGPTQAFLTRNLTIIGPSKVPLVEASEEIPGELITILFWLVIIMIIVIAILIIFILMFIVWIRRQSKMNYPIKSKNIVRKERSIAKGKGKGKAETDAGDAKKMKKDKDKEKEKSDTKKSESDQDDDTKYKTKSTSATPSSALKATATMSKSDKSPSAKPVPAKEVSKSAKISTVTPIKITSLMARESKSKSDSAKTETEEDESEHDTKKKAGKASSSSKPIAKPVHRATRVKKEESD
jgi:hypothetical protein